MELRKTTEQQGSQKALESKRMALGANKAQSEKQVEGQTTSSARALQRPAHIDRIELSEAARSHMASNEEGEALRAGLVTELRSAYQDGSLLSQERIERAARSLLGA